VTGDSNPQSGPFPRSSPAGSPAADPLDLPELRQGELDATQLDTLFADLRQGAEVDHVQVRGGPGSPRGDRVVSLDEARQLLRQERTPAVQIRYRYDGQSWCDTLLAHPGGVRLIRTKSL
jgi:hypothetical protein